MDHVAAQARRTIDRLALVPPGSRVVVALSGGSDSVALVHVLARLARPCAFTLAGLAHLNHRLRGAAADEDEAFVRRMAAALGLPIVVGAVDVALLARDTRTSLEGAGRQARYAFLETAADGLRADRIAVAHTRDDQAETFLMRLLRGAGSRGLGGIHPRLGRVVRPLLEVARDDLRRYLFERGIEFRDDETNRDLAVLRNRVRHLLVPYLERHFPGAGAEVLSRAAAIARDEEAVLEELTERASARILSVRHGVVRIDRPALCAEPRGIGRRVARRAVERAAPGRFVGFDAAERVLGLARGGGPSLDLPGVRVTRFGDALVVAAHRAATPDGEDETSSFRFSLSIPGEVRCEAGWGISAGVAPVVPALDAHGRIAAAADSRVGWVDAASIRDAFAVRSWRPGDRFRPLGAPGTRKLQDFFVDRKVPRRARHTVPLVVDDQDRIVWVAGYGVAEDFRVTAGTRAVVILKLEHWSNGA
jgi:tRNA(Ile)-lysidine synthase